MESIDYSNYILTKKEWFIYSVQGLAMVLLVSYLFYCSYWIIPFFLPFLYFFIQEKKRVLGRKRKREFSQQFKDAINAVAGALSVGYAIENAWKEAYKDMSKLYGEKEMITQELKKINIQMEMNIPIEGVIDELGKRTQIEDVISFADVFQVAKKNGGDLVQIIQSTAEVIADKVEIERDIQTMVAGKQLEQRAMQWIPFGIMFFIKSTSPDYFLPMYGNAFGILIMTGCLGGYVAAVWFGKRLVEIEV